MIRDVFTLFLTNSSAVYLERSCRNIINIKNKIETIKQINLIVKNGDWGVVTDIIKHWITVYIYKEWFSLITFNWYHYDNTNMRFGFSTNLPDIENSEYLSITVVKDNFDYLKDVHLLSKSSTQTVINKLLSLYPDSFFYYAELFAIAAHRQIENDSIEIRKIYSNDKLTIEYFNRKESSLTTVVLDILALDKVRDNWYIHLHNSGFETIG